MGDRNRTLTHSSLSLVFVVDHVPLRAASAICSSRLMAIVLVFRRSTGRQRKRRARQASINDVVDTGMQHPQPLPVKDMRRSCCDCCHAAAAAAAAVTGTSVSDTTLGTTTTMNGKRVTRSPPPTAMIRERRVKRLSAYLGQLSVACPCVSVQCDEWGWEGVGAVGSCHCGG